MQAIEKGFFSEHVNLPKGLGDVGRLSFPFSGVGKISGIELVLSQLRETLKFSPQNWFIEVVKHASEDILDLTGN